MLYVHRIGAQLAGNLHQAQAIGIATVEQCLEAHHPLLQRSRQQWQGRRLPDSAYDLDGQVEGKASPLQALQQRVATAAFDNWRARSRSTAESLQLAPAQAAVPGCCNPRTRRMASRSLRSPEYTVNSTLDWQVSQPLSLQTSVTWYGKQVLPRYDYRGNLATASEHMPTARYRPARWSV